MRILQVVHALPTDTYGGTELATSQIARRLGADHEVAVATPSGGDSAIRNAEVFDLPGGEDANVDAGRVGDGPAAGLIRPAVEERFGTLLDRFDPDVVHFQHLKGLSVTLPEICRDRGTACAATLHDFWTICHREQLYRPEGRLCSGPESNEKCAKCYREWRRSATADATDRDGSAYSADGRDRRHEPDRWSEGVARRTRLLQGALAETDRLIAPSRFLREQFVAAGVEPEEIVHRRNGIEVNRFSDTGFDPSTPLRVGYAGRITETKGVHLLVEAMRQIDCEIEVHVHGEFEPDERPYHASLQEAAAADDRIRIHGRYAERYAPYLQMDVLALPSIWYENCPLVILEAFASGVPVVTADVGGMAELVTEGSDGLTFAVGDAGALADRLCALASTPGLVSRLRAGVEEPKRLDDHVGELVSLYLSLVADRTDA